MRWGWRCLRALLNHRASLLVFSSWVYFLMPFKAGIKLFFTWPLKEHFNWRMFECLNFWTAIYRKYWVRPKRFLKTSFCWAGEIRRVRRANSNPCPINSCILFHNWTNLFFFSCRSAKLVGWYRSVPQTLPPLNNRGRKLSSPCCIPGDVGLSRPDAQATESPPSCSAKSEREEVDEETMEVQSVEGEYEKWLIFLICNAHARIRRARAHVRTHLPKFPEIFFYNYSWNQSL